MRIEVSLEWVGGFEERMQTKKATKGRALETSSQAKPNQGEWIQADPIHAKTIRADQSENKRGQARPSEVKRGQARPSKAKQREARKSVRRPRNSRAMIGTRRHRFEGGGEVDLNPPVIHFVWWCFRLFNTKQTIWKSFLWRHDRRPNRNNLLATFSQRRHKEAIVAL